MRTYPKLILAAVALDLRAKAIVFGFVGRKQGRRDRDFAAHVVFGIDKDEFTFEIGLDILMACNVKQQRCRA